MRVILLLSILALIFPASAGDYPERPLRLVVPFAPGGGNDFLARTAGRKLGELLGQPLVIDNRAGAGGTIATNLVANATPDGYTLLLGFIGPLAISPSLGKVPYDPVRDFAAVSMLATSHHVLAVHPAVNARTVRDLIVLANAQPGKLNYASGGTGTPLHLVAELFNATVGADVVHIPYKGSSPAAMSVVTGEAQMVFGNVASLLPHIRSHMLVALAVTSPERSQLLPQVPTLMEAGVKDVHVAAWYALVAPADTPQPTLAKLNGATAAVIRTSDFREQLFARGLAPVASDPAEFPAFLRAELRKWAAVIKAAGIKAD